MTANDERADVSAAQISGADAEDTSFSATNVPALSKRAQKRAKQKAHKKLVRSLEADAALSAAVFHDAGENFNVGVNKSEMFVETLPVVEPDDPNFAEMRAIFERFQARAVASNSVTDDTDADAKPQAPPALPHSEALSDTVADIVGADDDSGATSTEAPLSRRKLRESSRVSIAALKSFAPNPSVVEVHDVNSPDPLLLVSLKSQSNTVLVPAHWSAKRKYLSSKRGLEKPPFELPPFLADTGISEMRGIQLRKESEKKSKEKARERTRPKMGAIDIDYQILHDAFFRYQSKPELTPVGAVYYEGKENEIKLREIRPTVYSQALTEALGMTRLLAPPPWLPLMQRLGPPPSYPTLRIPGVNAPIPHGARWGLGENEWGKPPVDDFGRPRWGGDLFASDADTRRRHTHSQRRWGEILSVDDEDDYQQSAESDMEPVTLLPPDEEKEQESLPPLSVDTITAATLLAPPGTVTPATLDLRKYGGTATPVAVNPRKELYTVLEEKAAPLGRGLLGTTHTYVIPSSSGKEGVALSLEPEELQAIDAQTLKRKYDAATAPPAAELVAGEASMSKLAEDPAKKKRRKEAAAGSSAAQQIKEKFSF